MNAESALEMFKSPLLHLELASGENPNSETMWRVTSPHASATVHVDSLKENQNHFASPTTVVIFNQAKPLLRALLKKGIDIARPVCLYTLEHICAVPALETSVFERLNDLLKTIEANQCKGLARLECLVLRSFASMEEKGLYVDASLWSQVVAQKKDQALKAAKACEDILAPFTEKDLFGGSILNLNQPEEMRLLLEKVLGMSIKGIGNELLESLDHPLARAFLDYREASKIVSTYGERFLEFVNPKTKRIHADFISLGTSTGRVSCHKPNLQNLPSDPLFDACFAPPEGRSLVYGDFSACELRILAGLAHDTNFLSAINSDEDFHSAVASQLFEVEVSKTQNAHLRDRAKAINFGIIYGMGPRGLARALDISDDEAQTILNRYFLRFPRVKDYLEGCVSSAKRLGYARTLLGRRLYFENQESRGNEDTDISRIAKNMPIQGTAAELAKLAMTRVHERLTNEFKDAYLVNMIHDELVVECSSPDKERVAYIVKEEMLGAQEAFFDNVRAEVEVFWC